MEERLGIVNFNGMDFDVDLCEYTDGGHALVLYDGTRDRTTLVASVWSRDLLPGEIAIKNDGSVHGGVLEVLTSAGIVEPYHRVLDTGWSKFYVTRLGEKSRKKVVK